MALIVVLSVFNGFEGLVESLFNTFNPDILITAKEGKTFHSKEFPESSIKNIPGVIYYNEVVEENALIRQNSKQHIIRIKGVSEDFRQMSLLDSMIIDGEYLLKYQDEDYAILGAGVAYFLGFSLSDFSDPFTIYVPRRTSTSAINFANAFNQKSIFASGVFSVQQEFDTKYVIVPIDFVKELLEYNDELTSVELGLDKNAYLGKIQTEIKEMLGNDFSVKNQFQQQELLYKIMSSEKWAIFLILSFILIIATFNVIGSLSMLILDKKKDIAVLHALGANKKLIKRIFLTEGLLISFFGAVFGLALGAIICWLQQSFELISLGSGDGTFIINSYPVQMKALDFVYVFITVFVIGFAAAWLPVKQISKKYLEQKLA